MKITFSYCGASIINVTKIRKIIELVRHPIIISCAEVSFSCFVLISATLPRQQFILNQQADTHFFDTPHPLKYSITSMGLSVGAYSLTHLFSPLLSSDKSMPFFLHIILYRAM